LQFPSSWYFVSPGKKIKGEGIFRIQIEEHTLVLFRDPLNQVVALEARCSHLGADLGNGFIESGNLVCPLHHWKFNSEGFCTNHSQSNGKNFVQKKYPTKEAFGFVFVFLGDRFFEFPKFDFLDQFEFQSLPEVKLDTTWYTVGANGYDTLHLSVVHKRGLKENPICTFPEWYIFQMDTKAFVEGNQLSDYIIKFLSRDSITARITSYGGVLIVLESTLHLKTSVLLVFLRPEGDSVCIFTMAGVRKKSIWLDFFRKKISAFLYKKFLFKDIIPLTRMKLRTENLVHDPVLKYYYEYLVNLNLL
jgi:phenylpropionate dioxygenase-like ring-hydroxylating dioxygenase large terminal subunit